MEDINVTHKSNGQNCLESVCVCVWKGNRVLFDNKINTNHNIVDDDNDDDDKMKINNIL